MSGRQRLPDWEERLAAALAAALDQPFELGVHDCGSFACDVAEAITGTRPAPWLKGYATQEDLDALLMQHGGLEGAAAAAMAEMGREEIPVLMAQRGDWVVVDVGNELVMGIVTGHLAAVPGSDRLQHVPVQRFAKRAWAI
jgi:hypothetical protein